LEPNFNSLRAGDVERQGGGLDGGSTLNQQETHKRNSILLALKTAINWRLFWRNNTAVLDGIMQKIQPE
jgi:hypothetical protein